jgi:YjbE family integral membrane protein
MPDLTSSLFWIAVLQIIAIDIMLGGDNAVVIALACRKLPPEQRNKGIFWGVVGAIGLRVVMIFFALQLLALPYLKIVGALLLLWIGIKLLLPEGDDEHGSSIDGGTTLMAAIKTIVVADAVMSLDNVIAVAGASHGSMVLVTFGILVSIPIVVWGSKLVLTLMDRLPLVITLGAALLGWIAGGMLLTDPAMPTSVPAGIPYANYVFSSTGALLVVIVGKWLGSRSKPDKALELTSETSNPKN